MTTRQGIRTSRLAAVLVCGLGAPAALPAHHSTAEYDAATFVEARGEVVSVIWRNPHVRFQVSTKTIDGNEKLCSFPDDLRDLQAGA